jgi:hypothetical protein
MYFEQLPDYIPYSKQKQPITKLIRPLMFWERDPFDLRRMPLLNIPVPPIEQKLYLV